MADGFSWSLFNLPAEPPWHCDAAARLLPAVQTGTTRRPLMNPPPKHIGACPAGLEFASEPAGNGEEQHREERTQVVTVYEDMAPYRMRNKWESADSGEKANQASVPTLHFESRFESGTCIANSRYTPQIHRIFFPRLHLCGARGDRALFRAAATRPLDRTI